MIKYKIKEQKDGEVVISKKGHEVDFTIIEAMNNARLLEKNKLELEAKRDNCKVWIDNIEEYHPFVTNLTEEQLFISHKYQEDSRMYKAIEEKLEEINAALKRHDEEMTEIYKQLPELKHEE